MVDVRRFLLFAIGYCAAVMASEHLYGSLAVPSPFWLPDSVLLCGLLLARRDRWWLLVTSSCAIRLIIGAPSGTPLWFLLAAVAIDMLKGVVAASWLRRSVRPPVRLATLREFLVFVGIAAVAVPLLSALPAAPLRAMMGGPLWSNGYRWFLGDTLAQVVVTPPLLYWLTESSMSFRFRWKELVTLSIGLAVALYVAFVLPYGTEVPSLVYTPVPFLLWAAVRLRRFGTANALALTAIVAMLSAVRGTGLFSHSSSADSVLPIQLFLLVVALPLLLLATLVGEREKANEDLEAVLNAAPVPIVLATDPTGVRVMANRMARSLDDVTLVEEGTQAVAADTPPPPSGVRPGLAGSLLRLVTRTGIPVRGQLLTSVHEDNARRYWIANAAPIFGAGPEPRGAVAVLLDITERRVAEAALRESEALFHLVADSAPVVIWMSAADKLCTFFNKGWLDFTGRSLEQELGAGWLSGVHPEDRDECLEGYSRAFDARESFELEYRLRRHDGEYRWITDRGVPRHDANGEFAGYIGSGIDITDRKLAEAARQELNGRLLAAQERERARIAQELHDDFGQRMAVLQVGIEQLRSTVPRVSADGDDKLDGLVVMAAQLSSDLHHLSHQLHPTTLEIVGLTNSLRGLCRTFSEQYRLNVRFIHDDVPPQISTAVSLGVFRVAQEALRNVVKHSGASAATVELSGQDRFVDISVSDEGVGFEPAVAAGKGGLGLVSMRERLRPLGGRLQIQSSPARGTRIRARVPVHATTIVYPD